MATQLFSEHVRSALIDFFLYSYLMMDKPKSELSDEMLNAIYRTAARKRVAEETNDSAKELLMSIVHSRNPSGSLVFNLDRMLENSNKTNAKLTRFTHVHS